MEPSYEKSFSPPPSFKTEGKTKSEMPSTEFSYLKYAGDVLTPKNVERYFKIAGCWMNAQSMQLQGYIHSDEKLIHASKIYLAAHIDHKEYKILETFSQISFGDHLLITARNIANKEALMNETDKLAYINLRNSLSQSLKDKSLEKMLGYAESAFSERFIKSLQEDFIPKSVNVNGVCFSANLYLMGQILNSPELSENILLDLAQELHKGVPAEVAAKQEIFHELEISFTSEPDLDISQAGLRLHLINDIINMLIDRAERQGEKIPENFSKEMQAAINHVMDETIKSNQKEKFYLPNKAVIKKSDIFHALYPHNAPKNLQQKLLPLSEQSLKNLSEQNKLFLDRTLKNFNAKSVMGAESYKYNTMAHLYGFQQDIEGTYLARTLLGDYRDFGSSKEHLKNFDALEPGTYETHFATGSGHHSVLYIKLPGGEGYFFDPNHGLIKCGDYTHASVCHKIMSLYPPPEKRLPNENNDRNYQFSIGKYNSNRKN